MATTHALVGVLLAAIAVLFAPDAGLLPVAAAALGGLFPDFDLPGEHRKTLHFPVYYTLVAAPALVLAAVVPNRWTLAVGLFLAAAAIHSLSDVLGGGLELRPWEGTSDRAVYDHFSGRWLPPKRWIRYDGAPEDLLLAVALALPSLLILDGLADVLIAAALVVSAVYVICRKVMVEAAELVIDALPASVLVYVPDSLIDDFR